MKTIFIGLAFLLTIAGIPNCGGHLQAETGNQESLIRAINQSPDHVSHWWRDGYRTSPMVCWHGKNYGALLDTSAMTFNKFGLMRTTQDYENVPQNLNDKIDALPKATLNLMVRVGKENYKCIKGQNARLVQSGRYLQRTDVMGLIFANGKGEQLDATGRLEILAWPDTLTLWLDVTPNSDQVAMRVQIEFQSVLGRQMSETESAPCATGETRQVVLQVFPKQSSIAPLGLTVGATSNMQALPVNYDPVLQWHKIDIPRLPVKDKGKQHLETLRVHLKNDSEEHRTVKLNFARERGVQGITGLVGLYRDSELFPTGIPLQLGKNWHVMSNDKPDLYSGIWLYVVSMLKLPPKSNLELEFCLVQNFWGTLPLASHAQLCVIGCGLTQLWDQVAIGSWGESICYNPDRASNRSVITDIRALMINSALAGDPKWNWTPNVGGGDFLIYYNSKRQLQRMTEVRAQYLSQGPNLTDVIYQAVTADGAMACTARVQTPRCQDVNRTYHHISYKVLKPVSFSRLALYQLGADTYNDAEFKTLARGNMDGLLEEWAVKMDGKKGYHRSNEQAVGKMPWFSLHQTANHRSNRGMILRSWKAQLAGKPAQPHFSSYETIDQFPNINIELSLPPNIKSLKPGDYVEATIELIVMPQFANEYYGPDEKLREHLNKFEDTWQPMYRQAAEGAVNLKMKKGVLLDNYPLRVKAAAGDQLEFSTKGGVTFTPISIEGLKSYREYELQELVDTKWVAINQSVTQNDYWQTLYQPNSDSYTLVFNLNLSGDRQFRLKKIN